MTNKFLTTALLLSVALFSCKGGKDKDANSNETTDNTSITDKIENVSKAAEAMNEATKQAEVLKKMQPINGDALKAYFKEEALGLKRTSFSVSSAMAISVGEATYTKDDTTGFKINISDCAGEGGSGLYGLSAISEMKIETENDNGYEKTIDFMGSKALKSFQKNNSKYTVTFVTAKRFLIVMEGTNCSFENLEAFAKEFGLERLSNEK